MVAEIRWGRWLFPILLASFVYFSAPVLTPFCSGAFIAYFTRPWVRGLQRWRVPGVLAVTAVFLVLCFTVLLGLILLIPALEHQLKVLSGFLPRLLEWLVQDLWPWARDRFSIESVDVGSIKSLLGSHWQQAGSAVGTMAKILETLVLLSWEG